MEVVINDGYLGMLVREGVNHPKPQFSKDVLNKILRRIFQLKSVKNTQDLREIKSLHFEKLKGDLAGKHSIRVDKSYRMILTIDTENKIEIVYVEEVNNHYA